MPSFLGHPRATTILVPAPVYATWSPAGTNPNITLSNGNLTAEVTGPSTSNAYTASASSISDFDNGKRYFEIKIDVIGGDASSISIGFADTWQVFNGESLGDLPFGYAWRCDGFKMNAGNAEALGIPVLSGDIVMFAIHAYLDGADAKANMWFGLNGSWFGAGDPVTGSNPGFAGAMAMFATDWSVFATMKNSGDRIISNFGDLQFLYPTPVGFDRGWK